MTEQEQWCTGHTFTTTGEVYIRMILPRHAAVLFSSRNEAKRVDEWEINKRSVTANSSLHKKSVLFLVATILRSSKK